MRPRPVPITLGIVLLLLFLLVVPAGAASGTVSVYDRTRLAQTFSDPPARRCLTVRALRVPRLVNQTSGWIEAHTTRTCSRSPARVVGPGQGAGVSGLRAIRARS